MFIFIKTQRLLLNISHTKKKVSFTISNCSSPDNHAVVAITVSLKHHLYGLVNHMLIVPVFPGLPFEKNVHYHCAHLIQVK